MTNNKNKYIDEEKRFNDCVEGDTVSEGDTSDEEDNNAASKNLELPSGSADSCCRPRGKKRRFLCVAITIAAVVVTSAAIGGGIYAWRKNSGSTTPSTALEEELVSSITEPAIPEEEITPPIVEDENDVAPSTIKDENDSIPLSEDHTNLGILDDLMEQEASKAEETPIEDEPQPTQWPSLVGISGEDAKAQLELLYGEETYEIYILHEHSPVTRDYRFNRIRIFTNDEGIVTSVPRIG